MTAPLLIAVALSISSTNDYVYTKPFGISLNGSASYGQVEHILGEDVAFALEAFAERQAAISLMSTNSTYDARIIDSGRYNEIQSAKSNLLQRTQFAAFVKPDGELPDSFVVSSEDKLGSVLAKLGGLVSDPQISTTTVSDTDPLTKASMASLGSGLGSFTRVVFWQDGLTDEFGYSYLDKTIMSGQNDLVFDRQTGTFSPGDPLPAPQTHSGRLPGKQGKMASYTLSIRATKKRYTSWQSEYNADGYLHWTTYGSNSSGPLLETFTSKYSANQSEECYFSGNAARDSAEVSSVTAYAIYDYTKKVNLDVVSSASVAIKLSAQVDRSYKGYVSGGYLPRIVVEKPNVQGDLTTVANAIGESVITEEDVVSRVGDALDPQYPYETPQWSGVFTYTYSSANRKEEQSIDLDCFIVVVDLQFNARTL